MTAVLLFHHAQGQTTGFLAFADELREAGHTRSRAGSLRRQHVPGPQRRCGLRPESRLHGDHPPRDGGGWRLPADIVYAGFSLGVMPAQSLAQTRPGARGAILYHACLPISEFGGSWPEGVPLQIHMMDSDPWAEEDRPVAEALVKEVEDAELFLYPGSGRLFADSSLADYDEQAVRLLKERTLAFLRRVG